MARLVIAAPLPSRCRLSRLEHNHAREAGRERQGHACSPVPVVTRSWKLGIAPAKPIRIGVAARARHQNNGNPAFQHLCSIDATCGSP
jgi:hypothetical protein